MVTTEQHDRVLIARMGNPPHHLMCTQLVQELEELVARVDKDPSIGVVVLTGSSENDFLAHYDVSEFLDSIEGVPKLPNRPISALLRLTGAATAIPGVRKLLQKTPAAGILKLQDFHQLQLNMGRSGVIFIAAISGSAAGGALELSLSCDLRYTIYTAELGQPELMLGFPPGGGGSQRLTRLIGPGRAMEMMLAGRILNGQEAYDWGLVNGVCPAEQLMDKVMKIAEQNSRRSKSGVAAVKQAALEGGRLPLEQGLQVEQALVVGQFLDPRIQTMIQAYIDQTEKVGLLPVHDKPVREELIAGRFFDLTDT